MGRVVQLTFGGVAFLTFVGAFVYLAACDEEKVTASSDSLAQLCEDHSRTRIPDAPPYQGPGPHPILVFGPGVPTLDDQKSPAAVWSPKPVDAQLVGCVDAGSAADVIGTCHFDLPEPKDLDLRATTARLTVYEVRSRRKIADLTVHGTRCPVSVIQPVDQEWVDAVPLAAEVREAVRKYVEG
ncbi:hypothetical protein AB0E69_29165 [Kribbella sp. NPDC026611]|uniref:hypothetical protein n=1 Tax=Kribbella sp. NPDC026611 TaxID=3154911 RepID=UPI0033C57CE5